MRLLGWAWSHLTGVSLGGNSDTDARGVHARGTLTRRRQEGGLQATERASAETNLRHLDVGLPASGTLREWISVV